MSWHYLRVLPDEDVESAPVVSMSAVSLVTQPGAVKLIGRGGRVLHTFAGAAMLEDMTKLRDALDDFLGDKKRIANEVTLEKPWWKWW